MNVHQTCQLEAGFLLGNLRLRRAAFAFGGMGAQRVRVYGCTSNAPTSHIGETSSLEDADAGFADT